MVRFYYLVGSVDLVMMFGRILRFGQIPNSEPDDKAFGEIAKYSSKLPTTGQAPTS